MPMNAKTEEGGCSVISAQRLRGRDVSLGGHNHYRGPFIEPHARQMLALYYWLAIMMFYLILVTSWAHFSPFY